jgi:hypothetical protein
MRYIILIVLITFLISSCGGSSGPAVNPEVQKGSKGLTMRWYDNSPPNQIMENQEFGIAFIIKNEGSQDIENGYISIIIEEDYIEYQGWGGSATGVSANSARFNLYGKSKFVAEGEEQIIVYKVKAKKLDEQTETHTVFTSINTCYPYKTQFSDTVCIDTDLFNTRNIEKTCTVQDISSGGQGAPVAVTHVKSTMFTDGTNKVIPRFYITISNIQNGQVLGSDKIDEACGSSALTHEDFNKVVISAQLSGDTMKCTPIPAILKDKEALVTCEYSQGIDTSQGTYPTLLTIQLEYAYTDMIHGKTEIRSIPKD